MGCGLCCILTWVVLPCWILWSVWITIILRRIYFSNLKDLVKCDVKFYSKYTVAKRFDCINIDINKYVLVGIFILPFRILSMITIIVIEWIWCLIFAKIYGSNYKYSLWILIFAFSLSFSLTKASQHKNPSETSGTYLYQGPHIHIQVFRKTAI